MSISTSPGLRTRLAGVNWGTWLGALVLFLLPFGVLVAGIMAWRGHQGARDVLRLWLVLLGVLLAASIVIPVVVGAFAG